MRPDGYIYIGLMKAHFLAHRLAWFWVHGEWPPLLIDHLNGVRDDNRIANLRQADRRLNMENRRRESYNVTGLLGVKPNGKGFSARIGVRGVEHHLGTFKTPEEAHAVYVEAKRRLHEGCTI
jgi:AP2 domain.